MKDHLHITLLVKLNTGTFFYSKMLEVVWTCVSTKNTFLSAVILHDGSQCAPFIVLVAALLNNTIFYCSAEDVYSVTPTVPLCCPHNSHCATLSPNHQKSLGLGMNSAFWALTGYVGQGWLMPLLIVPAVIPQAVHLVAQGLIVSGKLDALVTSMLHLVHWTHALSRCSSCVPSISVLQRQKGEHCWTKPNFCLLVAQFQSQHTFC